MAGIYIHIPFCKKACHYCDFHFSTSLTYRVEMLDAILKEIVLQKNYLINQTIETIYFGGGTPSLFSGSDLSRIIGAINENFEVSETAEITLEANPDDLIPQKIKEIRQTAINRFSIGVQSFFEEDLKWMNRAHLASESESAIKRAQDSGFSNLNIDLIYGFPLLSDHKWMTNLQKAIQFEVTHLSPYALTIEPKTALAAFIKTKKQVPMDEEQSANQFISLMDTLCTAGYEHYEISNFSLPGRYSIHNTNYWKGVHYLGIGPSAHSFNGATRQWNVADNRQYLSALAKKEIPSTMEYLSLSNRANEFIMTSLRTIWGIDLEKFSSSFGNEALQHLKEQSHSYLEKGFISHTNGTISLTQNGKLYVDGIASDMFLEEDFKF
jgi:oxygen-independent coproporphyrinogen-3 oxidase